MSLGFCFWDIPMAVLLVVMGVVLIIQQNQHKKRMEEIQKKLDA